MATVFKQQKKKVKRKVHQNQRKGLARPGAAHHPEGGPKGKRLLTRIKEVLQEKSLNPKGGYNSRFDDVANEYVKMMEAGSYAHTAAFIEREEGKVPNRVANADGTNLKQYIGMPIDDDPEAP